jgi:type IV secretion system protein TrbI
VLPNAAGSKSAADPRPGQEQEKGPNEKAPNPDVPPPGTFNSAERKKYVLFEGTILETLLINRLEGSFAGPVSCLVTNAVYSHDRQHLLIPAGSKVIGEASKVDTFGQARLAVAFHRLLMPDGYSVNLDQFKGLDQAGGTALKDKVNNHYAKIFGASLAIGILGGAAQLGTGSVLTETGADRIRQGFSAGMAISGERILDRFLNILPTVTIREGSRVKVYLSNDLLLPDYNSHTMPANL